MHVIEQVLQFFIKNADFIFLYMCVIIRQGSYGGIDGVVIWPLVIPFLMYILSPVISNITAIDFVKLKLHVHCFTE